MKYIELKFRELKFRSVKRLPPEWVLRLRHTNTVKVIHSSLSTGGGRPQMPMLALFQASRTTDIP